MSDFTDLVLFTTPPSPPSDTDLDADVDLDQIIRSLDTSLECHAAPDTYNTPPHTSSPKLAGSASQPGLTGKRLRFNSVANQIPSDPPASSDDSSFPCTHLSKPIRSILKPPRPFQIQKNTAPSSPLEPEPFPDMLESVVKQLASPQTSARVDAWSTLHNSLRSYKRIPDTQTLESKLPLFEHFIQRDVAALSELTGRPDTRLVVPAIKLAIQLFADKDDISSKLSDEFVEWLANYAVRAVGTSDVPKEIAKNQLYLLTILKLCERSLNDQKATAIIEGLRTLHERVSGASIQALRISIYQRILDTRPSAMLASLRSWLPIVFKSMLSEVHDIQRRAVETGLLAAQLLGFHAQATAIFKEYCDTRSSGGKATIFEQLQEDVRAILKEGSSEAKLEVPRIWAAVVLFLRGNKSVLSEWPSLRGWITILFKCFNYRDPRMIIRSYTALNRFIFATKPDSKLSEDTEILNLMMRPIKAEFRRTASPENQVACRSAAWGSFCLIIYYAFKPNAPDSQKRKLWGKLIDGLLCDIAEIGPKEHQDACTILSILFEKSTLRIWNEDQVMANFRSPLKRRDLPKLGSVWVRQNSDIVLATLQKLLGRGSFSVPTDGSSDEIDQVWKSCMVAIADASTKEVTLSESAKRAMCNVNDTLRQLSLESARQNDESQPPALAERQYVELLLRLAQTSVDTIGALEFLGPDLNRPVLSSPKAQSGQISQSSNDHIRCAVPGLLGKLVSAAPFEHCETAPPIAVPLLDGLVHVLPTRRLKLRFLRDVKKCTDLDLADCMTENTLEHQMGLLIQNAIARVLASALARYSGIPINHEECQEVLSTLEIDISERRAVLWTNAESAIDFVAAETARNRGSEYLQTTVINPVLARIARPADRTLSLLAKVRLTSLCLANIRPPPEQRPSANAPDSTRLQSLASIVKNCLLEFSGDEGPLTKPFCTLSDDIANFASSERCLSSRIFLTGCQGGLSHWIGTNSPPKSRLLHLVILESSERLLKLVLTRCVADANVLEMFEPLLCGAIQSQSQPLAAVAVKICNDSFKRHQGMECPHRLLHLLQIIREHVEIDIPDALMKVDTSQAVQSLDDDRIPWIPRVISNQEESSSSVQTSPVKQTSRDLISISSGENNKAARIAALPENPVQGQQDEAALVEKHILESVPRADKLPASRQTENNHLEAVEPPPREDFGTPESIRNRGLADLEEIVSSPIENARRYRLQQAARRGRGRTPPAGEDEPDVPSSPPEMIRDTAAEGALTETDISAAPVTHVDPAWLGGTTDSQMEGVFETAADVDTEVNSQIADEENTVASRVDDSFAIEAQKASDLQVDETELPEDPPMFFTAAIDIDDDEEEVISYESPPSRESRQGVLVAIPSESSFGSFPEDDISLLRLPSNERPSTSKKRKRSSIVWSSVKRSRGRSPDPAIADADDEEEEEDDGTSCVELTRSGPDSLSFYEAAALILSKRASESQQTPVGTQNSTQKASQAASQTSSSSTKRRGRPSSKKRKTSSNSTPDPTPLAKKARLGKAKASGTASFGRRSSRLSKVQVEDIVDFTNDPDPIIDKSTDESREPHMELEQAAQQPSFATSDSSKAARDKGKERASISFDAVVDDEDATVTIEDDPPAHVPAEDDEIEDVDPPAPATATAGATETPVKAFSFRSDRAMPTSVPPTPSSSQSTLITSIAERLRGLFDDTKKLFLGGRDADRANLEGLTADLSREIRVAGTRKRKRDDANDGADAASSETGGGASRGTWLRLPGLT